MVPVGHLIALIVLVDPPDKGQVDTVALVGTEEGLSLQLGQQAGQLAVELEDAAVPEHKAHMVGMGACASRASSASRSSGRSSQRARVKGSIPPLLSRVGSILRPMHKKANLSSTNYDVAGGTQLSGAPTEVGSYKVTIAVPEENEAYRGSATIPFQIISDAEAMYQTAEGGDWQSGSFSQALSSVYEGGTVRVMKDVVLTDTATIAKNMTITSNDPAQPASITSSTSDHGYLLYICADVTMTNIIVDGGSEKGVTASRALIAVGDGTRSGTLTVGSSCKVRSNNNVTENGGGGVCVILGSLTIDGGAISHNHAYYGGGVYISAGSVTMTSGTIENNSAEKYGGGVYMENTSSEFYLNNGKINGNNANFGGGVYVNQSNIWALSGGEVTGNKATKWGGGALVASDAKLVISGSPVVDGNQNKDEDEPGENLYLDGYEHQGIHFPAVTLGEVNEAADIQIYTWLKPTEDSDLTVANPEQDRIIPAEVLTQLIYEDDNYVLAINSGGQLVLRTVTAAAASAKEILNDGTYTVTQAQANTEDAVKAWLAGELNCKIAGTGIAVTEDAIGTLKFTAAQAGTAEAEAGMNGSFEFTVELADSGVTVNISGTITATAYTKSSNAQLSGITLSSGMLEPNFSSEITQYTAHVENNVDRITVAAAPVDANAEVLVNNQNDKADIALAVGETIIPIQVTAEDGTSKEYTVVVVRAEKEPEEYTVTVLGSYTQNSGAGSYQVGETVTIRAGVREGYTFRGWVCVSGDVWLVNQPVASFMMPDHDVTIRALWTYDSCEPSAPDDGQEEDRDPSYPIMVDQDIANGTVTVSRRTSEEDALITLTVTPDPGYELTSLCVISGGTELRLSNEGNGKYAFVMPDQSVSITAIFAPISVSLPFTDVHSDDWFYDGVLFVYDKGLMAGTAEITFSPNLTTSRAMIWTILAAYHGTDTSTGDPWYAPGQAWAVANGVSDGTDPNGALTREQLAVMLWSYAGKPAAGGLTGYADAASVSDWAAEAMAWCVEQGVISGMDGGLNPQGIATRAQVATMLMQFIKNMEK